MHPACRRSIALQLRHARPDKGPDDSRALREGDTHGVERARSHCAEKPVWQDRIVRHALLHVLSEFLGAYIGVTSYVGYTQVGKGLLQQDC